MLSTIKNIFRVLLPFAFGAGILWWMYRGTNWTEFGQVLANKVKWNWMLFSLLFGILPQIIRALRWKQALQPLGEKPRTRTAIDSIFLSYASSLIIPRIGEVTRCGTLKNYDSTSFTKSIGTVVTERIVDSLTMLLLTGITFLCQLPLFFKFLNTTGTTLDGFLARFTTTGYVVTGLCVIGLVLLAALLFWRFKAFSKGKDVLMSVWSGILSLKGVKNIPLYIFYSFAIWICYFLHFYLAFFCFDFTAAFSPMAAFFIFCIGSFAVLVPTPNGAGPWHFAVKTMLVLYGVREADAVMFALVVHTVQTALVVFLGVYAWIDLNFLKRMPQVNAEKQKELT